MDTAEDAAQDPQDAGTVGDTTGHDAASHELLAHLCARRFADYLDKARKNEDDAARGDDPEAIHDLRVAIRRMRTALQVMEDAPAADAKALRALRKDLGPLAHALGEARDLDLMLANVDAFAETHGGADSGLALLRAQLAERRADAQEQVVRKLGKRKTRHALASIKRMVEHDERDAKKHADDLVAVRAFAGGAIWRRYGAVLAFERFLPHPALDQFHRLRITCKQVRYTLEFFADALGPGVDPLLTALVHAQDYLGALQDARMRNELISSLASKVAPHANGSGDGHTPAGDTHGGTAHDGTLTGQVAAYARAQADERDRLAGHALDEWHAVADISFRRDLALLIAAL